MKARHYILIGILLLALGLRLVRISWPATPVFDEQHFATYAADYLDDQAFFDIHPPLGKLIYAAVLFVATGGRPIATPTDFIKFNAAIPGSGTPPPEVVQPTGIPFGAYPYVPLRAASAVFGVLLVLAFYWFLRSAGVGETGALLGAFFAAVDNALVLQTKLILMDGMYLAFGFMALALWFRRPRMPVAAGVMLALSLGVKLIGAVFLGPIVIEYVYLAAAPRGEHGRKVSEARRQLLQFIAAAAIVFAAIVLLSFLFYSPARIIAFGQSMGTKIPTVSSPAARFLIASLMTTIVPWTGYVTGGSGPYTSPWYAWPAMLAPMYYYSNTVVLFGNPVLWIGSTLAAVFALALAARYARRLRSAAGELRPYFLLLAGYVSSLVPFFTFVRRETFLYHYLPALLFAFGLLAWMLSRWLRLGDIAALTRREWFFVATIAVLAGIGFLSVAPLTYGL